MSKQIHDGHRERMRNRFLEHGLDNFTEHEILELLLFYAIPRVDVNPLAHHLINTFGSLAGVLDTEPIDLCKVKGIGSNAAALLHMMPQLFQRYQVSRTAEKLVFDTAEKAAEYFIRYYTGKTYEQAAAVLLDNKCRVLNICEIGKGTISSVEIDTRTLIKRAVQYDATSVILAHNHPKGVCRASRVDIRLTSRVRELLAAIQVKLADHIVVSEDKWVSIGSKDNLPH